MNNFVRKLFKLKSCLRMSGKYVPLLKPKSLFLAFAMVLDIKWEADAALLSLLTSSIWTLWTTFYQPFSYHIYIGVSHATSILELLTLTQERTTEIENVTKKGRSLYLLKELDVNKILNVTSSLYTCPCPWRK